MNNDAWLSALAHELRRRGVSENAARQVVAEAAVHLRESGGDPMRVFGPPPAYASAVAESVGRPRRRPGEVLLEARGITKKYGRRPVLTGVDLVMRSGEVAAVIGANGCGKSTFLSICAGLTGADKGEVRVRGSLGYCPQDGGTAGFLDAGEHFVLIGAGRGMSREESVRIGGARASALDWTPGRGKQARHLSGGTRQKLNLVLAGLGEPDVLLLDEPYQGFDKGTYLDFWHQVWQWREAGKAIVVVTHLLNQLDRVDTVLELSPARKAVA
jgi:ABC-type multidrug transport system ATPase subunit